jgi:hypothetical protein
MFLAHFLVLFAALLLKRLFRCFAFLLLLSLQLLLVVLFLPLVVFTGTFLLHFPHLLASLFLVHGRSAAAWVTHATTAATTSTGGCGCG